MGETSILRDEVLRRIEEIGQAEIVIGIPSFNNSRTIGHVVRAATAGLAKYFPERRAVLINSDGGSSDGTPDAVAATELGQTERILVAHPVRSPQKLITAYQGIPGKGSAFRTIFEIARRLEARACAVVDSDLRSITPEWIELLVGPVLLHGFDYVCPLYSRHKFDGTITNSIVYPMVRSLFGRKIRQPIGGEFGFSGRLAAEFLRHDVWQSDVARYGIDIWMTTTVLCGDFRICQSYLGAKIHDAKDPGADLSTMLVQVTGSLFRQIEGNVGTWWEMEGSNGVPEFGFHYEVGLEPVPVNVGRMVRTFESGVRDFGVIHQQVLHAQTAAELAATDTSNPERFTLPVPLWTRIVYDYAAAFHRRVLHPEHLLKTLTPLYLGRTASWVNQAKDLGAQEVERELESLCRQFELEKSYLRQRWREGEV